MKKLIILGAVLLSFQITKAETPNEFISLDTVLSTCTDVNRQNFDNSLQIMQTILIKDFESSSKNRIESDEAQYLTDSRNILIPAKKSGLKDLIYGSTSGLLISSAVFNVPVGTTFLYSALPAALGYGVYKLTRFVNEDIIGGKVHKQITKESLLAYTENSKTLIGSLFLEFLEKIKDKDIAEARLLARNLKRAHSKIRSDVFWRASVANTKRDETLLGDYYLQNDAENETATFLYNRDLLIQIEEISSMRMLNAKFCSSL